MKYALFLALSFAIFSAPTFAQGDNVPPVIREAFTKQYPGAENTRYEDNLINTWVSFTLNGENYRANYKKNGQWEYTEKEWSFAKLPEAVKDGFKKSKYAAWTVEETKIVNRAGGLERYRVRVKKNKVQKKQLFFTPEGQLEEDSITL